MSEAIKQAVAALDPFAKAFIPTQTSDDPEFQAFLDRNTVTPSMTMGDFRRAHEAFAALAALSAEQPKPVAWLLRIGDSDDWGYCIDESDADFYGNQSGLRYEKKPLYASPIAAPASQPDAAAIRNKALEECASLATTRSTKANALVGFDIGYKQACTDMAEDFRALTTQSPAQEQQEQALSPRIDFYRGMGCEVRDDDPDSKTCGQWFPAKFIAIDLVGGEPIVQRHKRFPIFGVWSGVRGLPKEEIIAHYSSPVAQQARQPEQQAFDTYIDKEYGGLTNYAKRHTGSSARFERKAFTAGYVAGQPAPAVPEGYVLVPIKPTPAMIEAGANADPERESVWEAYLSAAAPAREGEKK